MHTFDSVEEIRGNDGSVIKYVFETKGDKCRERESSCKQNVM